MKPRLTIVILVLALVGSLWFGYGQKKRADGLEVDLTAKDVQLQETKLQLEEQRNIAIHRMMIENQLSEQLAEQARKAEVNLKKQSAAKK